MESESFNEWLLILLLLAPMVGIAVSIVKWTLLNGISPMPTSPKAKVCLFKHLPQKVQGKIYELGAGWGTLLFPLARFYPSCQVVGFESSPLPYLASKMRMSINGLSNLELHRQDFFSVSFEEASMVVCYLYPRAMSELAPKFENELKPGSLVISNTFAVPGRRAEAIYEVGDFYRSKIYVYRY